MPPETSKRKNCRYVQRYSWMRKAVTGQYKNHKKNGQWLRLPDGGRDTMQVVNYKEGILDGRYFKKSGFYSRDTAMISGYYKNGIRHGEWKLLYFNFSSNGTIITIDSACVYNNGVPEKYKTEKTKLYSPLFFRTIEGTIVNGKRNGGVTVKNAKGLEIQKGIYKNNMRDGKWTTMDAKNTRLLKSENYWSNDTLISGISISYEDGKKSVQYDSTLIEKKNKLVYRIKKTEFDFSEFRIKESFFLNEIKDSLWSWWYPNGKKASEAFYKNGNPEGHGISWYHSGNKYIEGNFVKGKQEGLCITFNDDGSIKDSGRYSAGLLQGSWLMNDEKLVNGHVVSTRYIKTYKKNILDGEFIKYYPSGNTEMICKYKNGELQGEYILFYPSGKKKKAGNIKNGFMVGKYQEWDERNKITLSKTYTDSDGIRSEIITGQIVNEAIEVESEKNIFTTGTIYEMNQVENAPGFTGGEAEMIKYLQTNIKYPQMEKEAGIQGKIYIKFVIELDGTVTNIQVIKSVSGTKNFEKEALRVIKNMPSWVPGKINGKAVRVNCTIPVSFKIQF